MKCVEKRRLKTRLFDHYQVFEIFDVQIFKSTSIYRSTVSTDKLYMHDHLRYFEHSNRGYLSPLNTLWYPTYIHQNTSKKGQKWHLKRYHMAPKSVPKSVPGNGIRLVSKRCRFGHRIWDPGIEHPDIENVVILRNYRKKDEMWSKPRIWRPNREMWQNRGQNLGSGSQNDGSGDIPRFRRKSDFFSMFRASKGLLGLVSAQGMQKTDFRWRPPWIGPRRGVLGLATPGWRRIFYRKKILGANGWFSGCFGPRDRPRKKKKKKKWVPATCPPRLPPVKTS